MSRRPRSRLGVLAAIIMLISLAISSCGRSPSRAQTTPLQRWMSASPMYVAHRGGDADWPEGTSYAYAQATAWNPNLALEVPVWRTSDGVWVVSEDATTGRVFGTDYRITATPWSTLSTLRTQTGDHPMTRLVNDILDVYGRNRILFIDDKANTDASEFLDLLGSYAGASRYVIKCYWASVDVCAAADKRGYVTWGYYYAQDMAHFAATQATFTMLGLNYTAPAADFQTLRATGKPVIAHVIATAAAAQTSLAQGARGLMVSGVTQVVPQG